MLPALFTNANVQRLECLQDSASPTGLSHSLKGYHTQTGQRLSVSGLAPDVLISESHAPYTDHSRLPLTCRAKPANASETTASIVAWIRERYKGTDSGIIYCQTRKDCEALAAELAECGMLAAYYHADMDPATREGVHMQWSKGKAHWHPSTAACRITNMTHKRHLPSRGGYSAMPLLVARQVTPDKSKWLCVEVG